MTEGKTKIRGGWRARSSAEMGKEDEYPRVESSQFGRSEKRRRMNTRGWRPRSSAEMGKKMPLLDPVTFALLCLLGFSSLEFL